MALIPEFLNRAYHKTVRKFALLEFIGRVKVVFKHILSGKVRILNHTATHCEL